MKQLFYGGILGISVLLALFSFSQNNTQIQKHQVLAATTAVQSNPLLSEINAYRRSAGLTAVLPSETNQSIAEIRATEITRYSAYSHTRPTTGGIFSDLYRELPAQSCENLQLQSTSAIDEAVRAWMNSEGHKQCLLHPESRYAGIAIETLLLPGEPSYVFTYIASSN